MPVESVNTPQVKKIMQPYGVGQAAEPSMTDEIVKMRRQKFAERMAENEFGHRTDEGLAATVVKTALERSDKAAERAETLAEKRDAAAEAARAEANRAKESLYAVSLNEVNRATANLQATLEEMKRQQPPPKGAGDIIREARELVKVIKEEAGLSGETTARQTAPLRDFNTEVALEKMRQDHEVAMKRLELELANANKEFMLKMEEFKDERERRWREYQDGKETRSSAMDMVGDLAAAAGAGFGNKFGNKPDNQPEEGTEYSAMVRSFPCQLCKTKVSLPTEGNIAKCPNAQCGAEYEIARK